LRKILPTYKYAKGGEKLGFWKKIKEIKYLKEEDIIEGDGKGYFNPKDFITREEAALVAYRTIKLIKQI